MNKQAGISSEAVTAKTGKTWEEWFKILDKAGAAKMAHKDIARLLQEKHGVPAWWRQMVTVGYEQARGLRVAHQKADGFSANISRTVNVPLPAVNAAWADAKKRKKWLGDPEMTIRKATENKSMRITWTDRSSIEVNFYAKGESKTQVTVQNYKLANAAGVAKSKEFWGDALERLKKFLAA